MRILLCSIMIIAGVMIGCQPTIAQPACTPRQQIDKCASQCRYCTEGSHGASCFAGWWNAWLKSEKKIAENMLANGSYSRGYSTVMLSTVLEAVAAKKGVNVKDLSQDDIVQYGGQLLGKAGASIARVFEWLGIAKNEMKQQCYNFCDFNPDTFRPPQRTLTDSRAASHLDAQACRTSGPGSWDDRWAIQAARKY